MPHDDKMLRLQLKSSTFRYNVLLGMKKKQLFSVCTSLLTHKIVVSSKRHFVVLLVQIEGSAINKFMSANSFPLIVFLKSSNYMQLFFHPFICLSLFLS